MLNFSSGAITMGYVIAAIFFLRFWRRTGDMLFVMFAVSFCLLAINQAVVALFDIKQEALSWVYLLRAAAFSLIIMAILLKNLPRPR